MAGGTIFCCLQCFRSALCWSAAFLRSEDHALQMTWTWQEGCIWVLSLIRSRMNEICHDTYAVTDLHAAGHELAKLSEAA